MIPNVGNKAREGAEAMSLAFVLLDFQHVALLLFRSSSVCGGFCQIKGQRKEEKIRV